MFDDIEENNEPRYQVIWDENGVKKTSEGDVKTLQDAGVPQETIDLAVSKQSSIDSVNKIRSAIYTDVADSDSMLGTVADASQMLVLGELVDLISLDEATSFEEYKQIKMNLLAGMSGGDASDLIASAKSFLAKVETGEIKMPFLAKEGQATGVFEDVAVRATGVANVLIAASEA
ncbi:hypothetical protein EOL70_13490 [Leucothrix sargassi]|nr:hypothetical protein EOL70_13490 [Leucothrix sargassi]